MNISQHISDLLFKHECVIVPGFGGFVSNYQSAKIHPVQHSFQPPSKSILFNKELDKNDGLLANRIVVTEGISYDEAMEKIREFSADATHTINQGKEIILQHIGTLSTDVEGNICFEQDTKINYLTDVYGMSQIVSPAVKRGHSRTIRQSPPAFTNRKSHEKKATLSGRMLRATAIISVVVLVSIVGFNYLYLGNPSMNLSGFLPFINQNVVQEKLPENNNQQEQTDVKIHDYNNESGLHKVNDKNTLLTETEKIAEKPKAETISDNKIIPDISENVDEKPESEIAKSIPVVVATPLKRMYHIIAGSFQNPDNAENLISSYRQNGYEPKIIGSSENGYVRVSIVAVLRKSDALEELKKVRNNFDPNVWLLRQ